MALMMFIAAGWLAMVSLVTMVLPRATGAEVTITSSTVEPSVASAAASAAWAWPAASASAAAEQHNSIRVVGFIDIPLGVRFAKAGVAGRLNGPGDRRRAKPLALWAP